MKTIDGINRKRTKTTINVIYIDTPVQLYKFLKGNKGE